MALGRKLKNEKNVTNTTTSPVGSKNSSGNSSAFSLDTTNDLTPHATPLTKKTKQDVVDLMNKCQTTNKSSTPSSTTTKTTTPTSTKPTNNKYLKESNENSNNENKTTSLTNGQQEKQQHQANIDHDELLKLVKMEPSEHTDIASTNNGMLSSETNAEAPNNSKNSKLG